MPIKNRGPFGRGDLGLWSDAHVLGLAIEGMRTDSGADISTVVPVVVMDAPRGSVTSGVIGADVVTGDLLFTA